MKRKYEITGVKITVDNIGREFLDAFKVKSSDGSTIYIDALVSACFDDEIDNLTADEQINWAKTKIGKFLFCDEISATNYVAIGKTYIV